MVDEGEWRRSAEDDARDVQVFFFYNFAFLISRVRLRTVTGSRKFGMLDDLNARVENT